MYQCPPTADLEWDEVTSIDVLAVGGNCIEFAIDVLSPHEAITVPAR
jgi:hypothetical protein